MSQTNGRGSAVAGAGAVERLIGNSPAMQRVRERIERIATADVPILILGETGTGKELCAQAIVSLSGKHLVAVNCAALTEGVIDSELFGHVRGAFTGAERSHKGLLAAANTGILFLDELAEVSPPVQSKLLRALESGEYRPVGSSDVQRSRFRIIAATGGNLEQLSADNKLRTDLLHRLGALRIVLPPLRERREDIPMLASSFLKTYRTRSRAAPTALSSGALRLLVEQEWPGNVRQLRNVVEAAAALAEPCEELQVGHVLDALPDGPAPWSGVERVVTLADAVHRAERWALFEAWRLTGGDRGRMAERLGISQATLYRKLAVHFPSGSDGSPPCDHENGGGPRLSRMRVQGMENSHL